MDVDSPKDSALDNELDIGSLLVEARSNAKLTSQDVADALKLNLEIISKIEANIFEQDLPVAFIRGYVKSYATKVGLDTQPILVAFDKATGVQVLSLKRVESISSFGKRTRDFNSNSALFKFISVLIILLFVTFAGWQIWTRFLAPLYLAEGASGQNSSASSIELSLNNEDSISNDEATVSTNAVTAQSPSEGTSEQNDASDLSPSRVASSASLQETKPLAETANIRPPASTGTIENQTSLGQEMDVVPDYPLSDVVLDFSADCWVRITDATGEVLAEGVKKNGKHMPLKGVAPIKVILGDPSAVSMSFDNQAFDLSGYRAGRRVQIILE